MPNNCCLTDIQPELLDVKLRHSLANSLESIFTTQSQHFDFAISNPCNTIKHIRNHRILPGVIGRYFQIVPALKSGQYLLANRLMTELVAKATIVPSLTQQPFTEDAIGDDFEHYARFVTFSSPNDGLIACPSETQWQSFVIHFKEAIDLLSNTESMFTKELDALILRVIGAVPPNGAKSHFGGISSLMLWGAVFLNIERYTSTLDIAEALVHESGHHLLFGLSFDEPLAINSLNDAFPSPLRSDLRPIDGVFHATFVCARICYFYSSLLQKNFLDQGQKTTATSRLANYQQRFHAGKKTLLQSGHLTPNGQHILSAAQTTYL